MAGYLLILLGLVALGALCAWAAGKMSNKQLDAKLTKAGIEPEFKAELFDVIKVPEVRETLRLIKTA